jgi:hypothetical protein
MFIVFVNRDNIQIFVTLVIIKHVECRTLGPFKLPRADLLRTETSSDSNIARFLAEGFCFATPRLAGECGNI